MQNVSLIPEGSILTEQMVDQYLAFHPDLNEETAVTGLNHFLAGEGELPAKLMNGNEVFYPLMETYAKANGQPGMPENWKTPLVEVDEKLSGTESSET